MRAFCALQNACIVLSLLHCILLLPRLMWQSRSASASPALHEPPCLPPTRYGWSHLLLLHVIHVCVMHHYVHCTCYRSFWTPSQAGSCTICAHHRRPGPAVWGQCQPAARDRRCQPSVAHTHYSPPVAAPPPPPLPTAAASPDAPLPSVSPLLLRPVCAFCSTCHFRPSTSRRRGRSATRSRHASL
jgi:hypothetical protein